MEQNRIDNEMNASIARVKRNAHFYHRRMSFITEKIPFNCNFVGFFKATTMKRGDDEVSLVKRYRKFYSMWKRWKETILK